MRKLQLFGEMRVEFSRTSTKASAEFDRIQGWGRMKKKRNREESTCPTKLNHHRVQRRQERRPSEPENLIIKKSPREQHTLRKASNLSSKNTTNPRRRESISKSNPHAPGGTSPAGGEHGSKTRSRNGAPGERIEAGIAARRAPDDVGAARGCARTPSMASAPGGAGGRTRRRRRTRDRPPRRQGA